LNKLESLWQNIINLYFIGGQYV